MLYFHRQCKDITLTARPLQCVFHVQEHACACCTCEAVSCIMCQQECLLLCSVTTRQPDATPQKWSSLRVSSRRSLLRARCLELQWETWGETDRERERGRSSTAMVRERLYLHSHVSACSVQVSAGTLLLWFCLSLVPFSVQLHVLPQTAGSEVSRGDSVRCSKLTWGWYMYKMSWCWIQTTMRLWCGKMHMALGCYTASKSSCGPLLNTLQ